eukprot:359802-Chlamydomonas_euryale.AAC.4
MNHAVVLSGLHGPVAGQIQVHRKLLLRLKKGGRLSELPCNTVGLTQCGMYVYNSSRPAMHVLWLSCDARFQQRSQGP